jgi:nucleoid DNA-binding protein
MNKAQFNKHIRAALTKRLKNSNIDEANAVIDVFIDAILSALEEDNEISLVGFGIKLTQKQELDVTLKRGRL